ncbi:MAG TPA: GAF domain-containing protein [Candidatus Baltobacteraceae bacterium]|nr:GAF domain-containing protein [Candidatus Baltobacteraceae bacterium]
MAVREAVLGAPQVAEEATPWKRWALYAVLTTSALLALHDLTTAMRSGAQPDLFIEAFGRIAICGLALYAVETTKGDRNVPLLVAGLVGMSFDVQWQSAWHGEDRWRGLSASNAVWWLTMACKYAGVAIGLTALLRLMARFGGVPCGRVRSAIWTIAPWLGVVFAGVGFAHGIAWVSQCSVVAGSSQCIPWDTDVASAVTARAYLATDALIRVLLVVTAVAAVPIVLPECKNRTEIMLVAAVVFALGTALDFSTRLAGIGGEPIEIVDALTTVAFPVLLFVAAMFRSLFDVEYVFERSTVYTTLALLIVVLITAVDQTFHFMLAKLAQGHDDDATLPARLAEYTFDVGAGGIFLFFFKPIEEGLTGVVRNAAVLRDRTERVDALRDLGEKLCTMKSPARLARTVVTDISRKAEVDFSDLFMRGEDGRYVAFASSRSPKPHPIDADDPVLKRLKGAKPVRLRGRAPALPGIELAVPMRLGGTLYGILACGPKRTRVDYADDEEKALCAIAREAAGALVALRAAV